MSGKKAQATAPPASLCSATTVSDGWVCPEPDSISAAARTGPASQRGRTVAALAADGRVLLWTLSAADVQPPKAGSRVPALASAVHRAMPERIGRLLPSSRPSATGAEMEPGAGVHGSRAAVAAYDQSHVAGPAAPAFIAASGKGPDACSSRVTAPAARLNAVPAEDNEAVGQSPGGMAAWIPLSSRDRGGVPSDGGTSKSGSADGSRAQHPDDFSTPVSLQG